MGADMVLGSFFIRGKAPIKQVSDTIRYIEDNFNLEEWEHFADDRGILPGTEEDYDNQLKENVLNWLKTFGDCLSSREVADFTFGDTTLYISGGISWGDSPTEASDYFYLIYDIPYQYQEMMGIVSGLNPIDYLMDQLGSKMPKQLKQDLEDWLVATKV